VNFALLYTLGLALVIVGIIVIVVAVIIASTGGAKKGKFQGAGVIMIGPIPIIFGTDRKSIKIAVALAIVLIVVLLLIFLVNRFLR
jgi:uncharacterized protein (TIGR00304 family)